MNNINLIGRLTKDPELRSTSNGAKVVHFTLAVSDGKNKDGVEQTDFINCSAWEKTAEVIAKYVKKGQRFGVSGKLKQKEYNDKDGKTIKAYEVLVRDFDFIEKREEQTDTTDFNVKGKDYSFNTGSVAADIANDDLPF